MNRYYTGIVRSGAEIINHGNPRESKLRDGYLLDPPLDHRLYPELEPPTALLARNTKGVSVFLILGRHRPGLDTVRGDPHFAARCAPRCGAKVRPLLESSLGGESREDRHETDGSLVQALPLRYASISRLQPPSIQKIDGPRTIG